MFIYFLKPTRAQHDAAIIDATSWQLPPVFNWLKAAGRIDDAEMARAFNCGIGLVVVVAKEKADTVIQKLKTAGETVARLGVIEAQQDSTAEPMVSMRNCDTAWN